MKTGWASFERPGAGVGCGIGTRECLERGLGRHVGFLPGKKQGLTVGRSRGGESEGAGCQLVGRTPYNVGTGPKRRDQVRIVRDRVADCRYCERRLLGIVVYSYAGSCWPQNAARLARRTDGMSGQTGLTLRVSHDGQTAGLDRRA